MSTPLDTLPLDVLVIILRSAAENSYEDAFTLGSTSRTLNATLKNYQKSILYPVLRRTAKRYAKRALKLAISERALAKSNSYPPQDEGEDGNEDSEDLEDEDREPTYPPRLYLEAYKYDIRIQCFASSLFAYYREVVRSSYLPFEDVYGLRDANGIAPRKVSKHLSLTPWISALYAYAVFGLKRARSSKPGVQAALNFLRSLIDTRLCAADDQFERYIREIRRELYTEEGIEGVQAEVLDSQVDMNFHMYCDKFKALMERPGEWKRLACMIGPWINEKDHNDDGYSWSQIWAMSEGAIREKTKHQLAYIRRARLDALDIDEEWTILSVLRKEDSTEFLQLTLDVDEASSRELLELNIRLRKDLESRIPRLG